jgi:hypothetical protein
VLADITAPAMPLLNSKTSHLCYNVARVSLLSGPDE